MCFCFSEKISWRYLRDCPVFGLLIALANPVCMCDLGAGSGGVLVGWFVPVSE